MSETKQRPVGISIIAVLMFINGLGTILGGFLVKADWFVYLLGALALFLAIGLWFLMRWAWWGTLLLQVVSIGSVLYDWFTAADSIYYFPLIMGFVIILYLMQSDIRAAFLSVANAQ